jgi:hypothetical protein
VLSTKSSASSSFRVISVLILVDPYFRFTKLVSSIAWKAGECPSRVYHGFPSDKHALGCMRDTKVMFMKLCFRVGLYLHSGLPCAVRPRDPGSQRAAWALERKQVIAKRIIRTSGLLQSCSALLCILTWQCHRG